MMLEASWPKCNLEVIIGLIILVNVPKIKENFVNIFYLVYQRNALVWLEKILGFLLCESFWRWWLENVLQVFNQI